MPLVKVGLDLDAASNTVYYNTVHYHAVQCCRAYRWFTLQEEGITELLMAPADLKKDIPGISGTRALTDNLSDMKAQVASNFKGIGLVTALIEEYTLEVVQAYMHHIQVRMAVLQSR